VGFSSFATNLDPADTDSAEDAYVKDLVTGDLILASVSKTGVKANGQVGAMSSNGGRVALASNGFLPDTDPAEKVYLKNLTTGAVRLVSTSDSGRKANGSSFPMSLADGKVGFVSAANDLDPADTEGDFDVYVKDLVSRDLTLVSASDPSLPGRDDHAQGGALSADGVFATFSTEANNVGAADSDHRSDVWVRNLETGGLTLVSTSAQGIKGNDDSFASFGSISADGSTVAFESRATNLDPADTDSIRDIYVKTIA
jgi:Tol biopolymer transport system component